ncbi:MAG: site-2 protease family protein, partial [Thermodesulfobacteriota bacterium]
AILLTHEMGHFLASKKHGVDATLPYFIPAPTFLGTFGAFIKMRSPILNKNALIDIGASGPLAGFVVSIIVTFFGLKLSTITSATMQEGMKLGSPIVFHIISLLSIGSIPENQDILLHPMAFAGWIGFLVTSLNLLPIGQLDGGHVVYAIIGKKHRAISIAMLFLLVFFGLYGWPGWLIWAFIVSLLGTSHPPIMDTSYTLDRRRKMVGWGTLLVFILTFTPMPIL